MGAQRRYLLPGAVARSGSTLVGNAMGAGDAAKVRQEDSGTVGGEAAGKAGGDREGEAEDGQRRAWRAG